MNRQRFEDSMLPGPIHLQFLFKDLLLRRFGITFLKTFIRKVRIDILTSHRLIDWTQAYNMKYFLYRMTMNTM